MTNNMEKQVEQNKTYNYAFVPAITTIAFPLLIGRTKNTYFATDKTDQPKPDKLMVEKYELTNDLLKFFVAKGFPRKQWVLIKEMPIYEITSIESFGNELRIVSNGSVCEFIFKEKNESFVMLRDQLRGLLEEKQKNIEIIENTNPRKNDLNSLISFSISIVDLSFNILMGLSRKKINWGILEGSIDSVKTNLSFKGQTIEPLNVDFGEFFAAIKKHAPKETSKEAINILKTIYSYFDSLKTDNELNKELQNAKTAILAYYALNDLILAKFVGGRTDETENSALESALLSLADKSNVKINFGELNASLARLSVEGENLSLVEDTRAIFKDQLRLL